jgi:hypothetical protein
MFGRVMTGQGFVMTEIIGLSQRRRGFSGKNDRMGVHICRRARLLS